MTFLVSGISFRDQKVADRLPFLDFLGNIFLQIKKVGRLYCNTKLIDNSLTDIFLRLKKLFQVDFINVTLVLKTLLGISCNS